MERAAGAYERVETGRAGVRESARVPPGSDELLARLVASGGQRPFSMLYQRYHAQLYRYCYSIVRNEADAQDALQSTFTRALIALRGGRRNAPVRPWLYRIAHNESISVLRTRPPVAAETQRDAFPSGPSAEERAHQRARLELLLADLTQLAERGRAALVMRELGGLSHKEIAAALQISVGAAKQAIFEARSALSELAEGRAMACDDVRRRLSDGDRRALRGRPVRAHLRDCAACSAFATAIPARQAELRGLCPVLPPAAAGALLASVLQGAADHSGRAAAGASAASGGSTVAGTGGATSTVASAAKVLAAVIAPKALLATALVAGAAAGAGGLVAGAFGSRKAQASRVEARAAHRAGAREASARSQRGSAAARTHSRSSESTTGSAKAHGSRTGASAKSKNSSNSGKGPGKNGSAAGNNGGAHGNSGSAPGHTGSAPGNSGNAPGHTSNQPGNSGSAPGHNKSSNAPDPPGQSKHDHTPPGQAKHRGNPHG